MYRIAGARRILLALAGLLVGSVLTLAPARSGLEVAGQKVRGALPTMSDNVDLAGHLPFPGAIGARLRGDVMYVTGVAGLATYDISVPARPLPLGFLPLPHFENEDVSIGGNTLVISADTAVGVDYYGIVDISDPRLPRFRRTGATGADGHTASCVNPHPEPDPRNCRFALLAGGRGLRVMDTHSGAIVGEPVATHVGGTHDVQFDSAGYAWVAGRGGTAAYDVSDPTRPRLVAKTDATGSRGPLNDFIHHNSFRPDVAPGKPGDVVLITEEDYLNVACGDAGLFQTWRINGPLDPANPAVLTNLDTWDTSEGTLPEPQDSTEAAYFCSSHYFDVRGGIASVAWYGNGTRLLDVSNPRDIRQVGWFVPPNSEVWAAYWAPKDDSVVFVVDFKRGIDVLRVRRGAPPGAGLPARPAPPEGGPTSRPHPVYGWGCRLAA